MIAIDKVKIKGHHNVRAFHKTTLEITKDDYLTSRGDCIIGILANKGARDLSEDLKKIARNDKSFIYGVIRVKEFLDVVHGRGSSKFTFENQNKIIFRKSTFIEGSTVMINSDKAARDINREIIDLLKTEIEGEIIILASDQPLEDKEILRIVVNLNPRSST
ncbi:DUF371 domain-containing protein [Saccharolobus solfataricus]|uniref:DUF371 domain-containing protein n=3 Tax=Saccharolobus solfataricus TaxID=2287 RepID=Q97WJ3_SACS2|nr:DUF371 domain-containing protein [Saccharolobus solfataricus]AAK42393.1 Conserved hypothetical protein [Saccharolobus solfataricus P2]AKA72495.1 DUF371 domain-containing protein [Saccharolobus solfataricus]AKA75195.1 DUF371 domain-containing protein [Saccharolobus solfataricus]AKA77888.1 DUF371 domain-containing protein [Saccharolobus solfataricus]AZF67009.1 DUF371 domain-containing protein [Saccharolobus solfataricus]